MSSRSALRGSYRQHSAQAVKIGRPSPQERLEVTLVLRRKQAAPHPWELEHYFSHDELATMHGAHASDIEAVETFASSHHLSVTQVDEGARTVTLAGALAEIVSVFGAEAELHRSGNHTYRSRRGHLYVPSELAGRVIAVLGIDSRPVAHTHQTIAPRTDASFGFTPRQLADLYNFPKHTTGNHQTIALIELGGGYRNTDLSTYWKRLGLKNVKVSAISVNGGGNKPKG